LRPALDALRPPRHEPADETLKEPAVEMAGAEQALAAKAHPAIDGIEEGATLVAPGELCGRLEEHHANRDVLTEGEAVLQS